MNTPETKTGRRSPRRASPVGGLVRLALVLVGAAAVLVAVFQLAGPGRDRADAPAPTAIPTASPEPTPALPQVDLDSWELRLVDIDHPLGENFAPPSLTLIADNERVDSRIAPAIEKLLEDAHAAGYTTYFCSGYRDYATQYSIYWRHIDQYTAEGMTEQEAHAKTLLAVQYPGCSEHQSGLSADILESRSQNMVPEIGGSGLMLWLEQHCAEYGFVIRYPDGKTDITSIEYEPWHLRYVGQEAARYMMDNDLCLEEFLALYQEQEPAGEQSLADQFGLDPMIVTSAQTVLVMDRDSGKALYEKNAAGRLYPASTTKLMTALCAAEACDDLDKTVVTVRQEALDQLPNDVNSLAGLTAGEELTMEQLLYCMLLASGNDAALAAADYVDGSVDAFVQRMNRRAAELGCTDTCFVNPHGLAGEEQYVTAWDLARIMEAFLDVPELARIAREPEYTFSTNKRRDVHLTSSDLLLNKESPLYEPSVVAGKTGTVSLGACFVSAQEQDGLRTICVVAGVPAKDQYGYLISPNPALAEGRKFITWVNSTFVPVTLYEQGEEISVMVGDTRQYVQPAGGTSITVALPAAQAEQVTRELTLTPGLRMPLSPGMEVGTVSWSCGGTPIVEPVPLVLADDTSSMPMWIWIALWAVLAVLVVISLLVRRARKRRMRRRRRWEAIQPVPTRAPSRRERVPDRDDDGEPGDWEW